MKNMRCRFLLILFFFAAGSVPAWSATFDVNSLGDGIDAIVGNGICATAGGVCTLRAAVQEANFFSDADSVNLPNGTITLTIPGADEDIAATGDLDIIHDVTIAGLLGGDSNIDGNGTVTQDRIFEVHGGTLTILRVDIMGGQVDGPGGCIRNTAGLDFSGGLLFNCQATGAAGYGGAVENASGGTATIHSGVINYCQASFGGGALSNQGTATLFTIAIRNNTAPIGGGIRNAAGGTLNLTDVLVSENDGGGLTNIGTATIVRSTISANTSASSPGGIANLGVITLENSTVSGNTTGGTGGGISNWNTATLTMNNVTVSANTASDAGGMDAQGAINIGNTILAGNIDSSGPQTPDCLGTLNSLGHNLIQNISGCVINGDSTGNITGQDPLMGSLSYNGGYADTHPLLPGSPAVDAGDAASCESEDQRAVVRPQFAACDIGAYEADPSYDLSCNPTSLSIPPGGSSPVDVSIVSQFGFTNAVTLSCPGLPAGITCSWNPGQVTPPADGTGTSVLTVSVDPMMADGNYIVRVHGAAPNRPRNQEITITVNGASFLFSDDFEDGDASNWAFTKGTWSVVSGDLQGVVTKKGDALTPDFGGCSVCSFEADIVMDSVSARASLLGWYMDKKNLVEVRLMEDKDKVLLIQKSGGLTVAKGKSLITIDAGQSYNVRVTFDGIAFSVQLNSMTVLTVPFGALPSGNGGLRVKSASGSPATARFEQIIVE